MRLFLAGCTGQVGSRLVPQLKTRGDQIVLLSRNTAKAQAKFGDGFEYVEGDPMQPGLWMDKISGCQAVINLVGEGIFNRRWSDEYKAVLRDSRVKSTQNIVAAIRKATPPVSPPSQGGEKTSSPPYEGGDTGGVQVLINGSAIGYYGYHEDEMLTEDSPPGDDFLAKACVEWEAAAQQAEESGIRVVRLRTGVVLDKEGGALKQMLLPFKLFVGGKTGSGRQWVSWIHHADEVGVILMCLDNRAARGAINATTPTPVTNTELAKAIGAALGRPSFFPTPAFMLRVMLGEVSELVTKGQRVLPRRAQELGYTFKFPEIGGALREILSP